MFFQALWTIQTEARKKTPGSRAIKTVQLSGKPKVEGGEVMPEPATQAEETEAYHDVPQAPPTETTKGATPAATEKATDTVVPQRVSFADKPVLIPIGPAMQAAGNRTTALRASRAHVILHNDMCYKAMKEEHTIKAPSQWLEKLATRRNKPLSALETWSAARRETPTTSATEATTQPAQLRSRLANKVDVDTSHQALPCAQAGGDTSIERLKTWNEQWDEVRLLVVDPSVEAFCDLVDQTGAATSEMT